MGGDSDLVGVACDLDVVAWGGRIKIWTLQSRVVAHSAQCLLVEDQFGDPAGEVDASGDSRRAAHSDFWRSPDELYGNYTRRRGKIQTDHAKSPLDL